MQFFRLLDDIHATGRWHISAIYGEDGKYYDLLAARKVPKQSYAAEIHHPGLPLEFSLTSFAVPVALPRLARAMGAQASQELQTLPLVVRYGEATMAAFVVNVTSSVDCLDESNSDFDREPVGTGREKYRAIVKFRLDRSKIPPGSQIFRLAGWTIGVFVSETFRDVMMGAGCNGAIFQPEV